MHNSQLSLYSFNTYQFRIRCESKEMTKTLSRLFALVDIFVETPEIDNVVAALSKLDNLEALYEVTGEFDIVTLVSAADIEEFMDILKNRILKIKGVRSAVSSTCPVF